MKKMKSIFLVLIVSFIAIPPSRGQKINHILSKAKEASEVRRDGAVLEYCNTILSKYPENQEALLLRAKSYVRLKVLDSAQIDLGKLNSIQGENKILFDAWYWLGKAYANLEIEHQYLDSMHTIDLESLKTEIAKNNKSTVICYLRAMAYISPQWHIVYHEIGVACLNAELYEMGISHLSKSINYDSENLLLYYYRAKCYVAVDSLDLAKQDYQKSLQRMEDSYAGFANIELGIVYYKQKKYELALYYIDRGIRSKNKDNCEAYYYMGLSKWALGDDTACNDFKIVNHSQCAIKQYNTEKYCPIENGD